MQNIKIAVITDLHFSYNDIDVPQRGMGRHADLLLLRIIRKLNNQIHPDIVLLAGDIIDIDFKAKELYISLKEILKGLDSQYIIIPGNHDSREKFYNVFKAPPTFLDVKGFRIISFDDPELPGFNAVRVPNSLSRMQNCAMNFEGPIISLQHVPLIESSKNPCREHYTNADEIIAIIRDINGGITISGHAHKGVDGVIGNDKIYSIVVPSLCDFPFQYMIINADTNLNIKTSVEKLYYV